LLAAVCDDGILDAVIDVIRKNAAFEEVRLGAVGAEADDAGGPGGRHAGNLAEFIHAGVIDVDARSGWWSGFGLLRGLRRAGLRMARDGAQARGKKENQNRGEKHRALLAELHAFILRLLMGRRQEKDLTARGIYT
jgi:hypothetical protein